jgi:hypothetical protein
MLKSCPISQKRVDTHIVRTISALAVLTAVLFLLTNQSFLLFLLFFDYSMRLIRMEKFSPFYQISAFIVKTLKLQPHKSDEAPKRFALILGWSMTLLMVLFYLFSLSFLVYALVVILLFCATLETLFNFCIGCKIYPYVASFQKSKGE